jgi:hypothetical protein
VDRRWQTYTRANTKDGLASDDIKSLAVDTDGVLWFGTFGDGLARRDKDGQWQTFSKANTKGGMG